MNPAVKIDGLAKVAWWEWVLRFVFGGLVTVGTGIIAHGYGAAIGGLFVAFPAILPASLTLVTSHEGRKQAQQAARGARVGALALIAFAAVTAALVPHHGLLLTLTAATLAWLVGAVGLWFATL